MQYKVNSNANSAEFKLSGKFTFADNPVFAEVLDFISNGTHNSVTFDLSEIEFIDSAALGMLLIAREKVITKNGSASIKGANGYTKKILTVSKFNEMFNIVE